MLFVVTGGTIDKRPSYLPDSVTFDESSKIFGETHLTEMLEKAKLLGEFTINDSLGMVDSLEMTDEYREKIGEVIAESEEDQVVITHGTDTMPVTAMFLERNLALARKTIVLTGAMVPYSLGEKSDAMFNIGNAIAYARALPSGVYVAMNGQAHPAYNVQKDVDAGVFKPLS